MSDIGFSEAQPLAVDELEAVHVAGPLTDRQKQVLDFIEGYLQVHGKAPLIDEIRAVLGVSSKSTVIDHLRELEERGYIRREPRIKRGISVLPRIGQEFYVIATNPTIAPDKVLALAKRSVQDASGFQEAYQIIVLAQILSLARARSISLYLADEEEKKLEPYLWQGCWKEDERPRTFERGVGIAGNVWVEGEVFVSHGNVQEEEEWFQKSKNPRSRTVRSMLVVPIFDFAGKVIGVVNLDSSTEGRFSDDLGKHIQKHLRHVYEIIGKPKWGECLSEKAAVDVFLCILKNAIAQYYVY